MNIPFGEKLQVTPCANMTRVICNPLYEGSFDKSEKTQRRAQIRLAGGIRQFKRMRAAQKFGAAI